MDMNSITTDSSMTNPITKSPISRSPSRLNNTEINNATTSKGTTRISPKLNRTSRHAWKEQLRAECLVKARRDRLVALRRTRGLPSIISNELPIESITESTIELPIELPIESTVESPIESPIKSLPKRLRPFSFHQDQFSNLTNESSATLAAKQLVEEELHRALTGLAHCQTRQQRSQWQSLQINHCSQNYSQHYSQHYSQQYPGQYPGQFSCQHSNHNSNRDLLLHKPECPFSEQEMEELLHDVMHELQKEDQFIEEELWNMEQQEILHQETIQSQIHDYQSWQLSDQVDLWNDEEEEHNNDDDLLPEMTSSLHSNHDDFIPKDSHDSYDSHDVYNTNNFGPSTNPQVPCPICFHELLPTHPIRCIRAPLHCNFYWNASQDTFNNGVYDGNESNTHSSSSSLLLLNQLKQVLMQTYEEHASVCTGILNFKMDPTDNKILLACCPKCHCNKMVV